VQIAKGREMTYNSIIMDEVYLQGKSSNKLMKAHLIFNTLFLLFNFTSKFLYYRLRLDKFIIIIARLYVALGIYK
jgi:hypothetical protein